MVDTRQAPGRTPGSFTFQFVPEEAGKVVGCIGSKAPYVVFGPPAVIILDPVSGKMIKKMVSQGGYGQGRQVPARGYRGMLEKLPEGRSKDRLSIRTPPMKKGANPECSFPRRFSRNCFLYVKNGK